MALPVDFNIRVELSETLTVTRIIGGYLFSDKYGYSRSTQFLTDEEVSAEIIEEPKLPTVFYIREELTPTTFVTRIDGGYLYGDKQGASVITQFISYSVANGYGSSYTDHHNGFYNIQFGQVVEIKENKQMVNFNMLTLDGTLTVNGQLILR
jgi:hypothetical protein